METVIPPRDHGPSTYKYTWDENGEVMQVTRSITAQSPSSISGMWLASTDGVRDEQHTSSPERLTRGGRQSVQWPLQSIVLDTEIPSPTLSIHQRQRVTSTQSQYSAWQPPNRHRDSHGPWERDSIDQGGIVPDYLASFLRGETPQSGVAYRKESGFHGSGGAGRTVAPNHGVVSLVANNRHQQHRSRVADFEGFRLSDDSLSPLGHVDSRDADEGQLFLSLEKSAGGGTWWRGLVAGWRAGVALNVLVMFLMLIVGFICLIVAISGVSLTSGRLAIFVGGCATAEDIDWGLHAVISVFVVVLVAGANYVFQVLSSPTREEVTAAHQSRRWLDIGIPSFRNLGRIERGRMLLAVVVLSSAVFTQIM